MGAAQVFELLRCNIRSRDVLTKKSIENAIAVVYALGGSTNAVLHILAWAREADLENEVTIDDFQRIGEKVPLLANLSPHGKYHMEDLDSIGGVPLVMRELLEAGLLHGDCLTVSGKTVAENLKNTPRITDLDSQDILRPLSN